MTDTNFEDADKIERTSFSLMSTIALTQKMSPLSVAEVTDVFVKTIRALDKANGYLGLELEVMRRFANIPDAVERVGQESPASEDLATIIFSWSKHLLSQDLITQKELAMALATAAVAMDDGPETPLVLPALTDLLNEVSDK